MDSVLKTVYGDFAHYYSTIPARPIDAVIKVDYKLYGCPIRKDEFVRLTKDLLQGKQPYMLANPVCAECKMAGNVCVFEKGKSCLGPVTRGGCQAVCVTGGSLCWGCRGLVDEPNVQSEKEVLAKHNVTVEDMLKKFRLYYGFHEVAKSA
jgi:coenzyme F420-reducing hydrogenase gamma subunit